MIRIDIMRNDGVLVETKWVRETPTSTAFMGKLAFDLEDWNRLVSNIEREPDHYKIVTTEVVQRS